MTAPLCDDALPPYGTVVFDCDSTLCDLEGIDELAAGSEHAAETAAATARAMAGEVPLERIYGERLGVLKPERAAVEALAGRYLETRLPHSVELLRALASLGKRVCIVSGGLRQAIQPLAELCGVAEADLFAVEIYHDRAGAYAGFDELSPLVRADGKLEVLRELSRHEHAGGLALVGDGMTDLAGARAARRFVAFGGVARREAVFAAAQVQVEQPDLAALLPCLTSPDEIEVLALDPTHAALVSAARHLTP